MSHSLPYLKQRKFDFAEVPFSEKSRLLRNISQILIFTFSMNKKEKSKCDF